MLLRNAIYQTIRRAILTNEFEPGQELREQVLAERYHVSRSPIRDTLLRLEQENLVTVLPRQGYRIRPIALADVADIFGFRLLIEPACAAGAAMAGKTALRSLDRFRDLAEGDDTWAADIELDASFHHAVAELSGNHRLAVIAQDLTEQFVRLRRISLPAGGQDLIRQDCAEHAAIIDALQAQDADRASRLCREHASLAQAPIAAALRPGSEFHEPPDTR